MNKEIKQIYVSMELAENEIKILAGEYFNTRFNIIRSEKFYTNAINDFRITDQQQLVSDIRSAVRECSDRIGSDIEKVILVLPAYNFKRFPLRSKVVTEDGTVRKSDIARAVSNSLKAQVDEDVMIVDPMIVKYTVNGISTRRIPENESCSELLVDIDLLCADIKMCYEYVSAVEASGLKVLDIVLNTYASAKEAALFEESLNRSIVVLDIGRTCTYLSLLSKGKLVSTEIVFDGINSLINKVYRTYSIPYNDIAKLIKYDVNFDCEYMNDVIYAWTDQGSTRTITTAMLNETVEKTLDSLADKLIAMCKPVLDSGASIVLMGEGQQMKALTEKIKEKSGTEVRSYCPETIGVRDPSMTSEYGAFITYREKALLNDLSVNCIDLLRYDALIKEKELDSEGETITTKIKNLFKQYMERGGN
jgi:cell division protein FtsA